MREKKCARPRAFFVMGCTARNGDERDSAWPPAFFATSKHGAISPAGGPIYEEDLIYAHFDKGRSTWGIWRSRRNAFGRASSPLFKTECWRTVQRCSVQSRQVCGLLWAVPMRIRVIGEWFDPAWLDVERVESWKISRKESRLWESRWNTDHSREKSRW
jgi:hypothetical protein